MTFHDFISQMKTLICSVAGDWSFWGFSECISGCWAWLASEFHFAPVLERGIMNCHDASWFQLWLQILNPFIIQHYCLPRIYLSFSSRPAYCMGDHTMKVPMALFKQNRQRLVAKLRECKEVPAGAIVVLQGGDSNQRYCSDVDFAPFRQVQHGHLCTMSLHFIVEIITIMTVYYPSILVPTLFHNLTYCVYFQESYFQWLFGVTEPGFYGALEVDTGKCILFPPKLHESYEIWMGKWGHILLPVLANIRHFSLPFVCSCNVGLFLLSMIIVPLILLLQDWRTWLFSR